MHGYSIKLTVTVYCIIIMYTVLYFRASAKTVTRYSLTPLAHITHNVRARDLPFGFADRAQSKLQGTKDTTGAVYIQYS